MPSHLELTARRCQPTETALSDDGITACLSAVPEWALTGNCISRTYSFRNYYETLAFVNAIAYTIHLEDHHPEIILTYNRCVIKFDTHSVNQGRGGLSENDFICAAKVDAIFQQSFS